MPTLSDQLMGITKYHKQVSEEEIAKMKASCEETEYKKDLCFLYLREQGKDIFIEVCYWPSGCTDFEHYIVGEDHIMHMAKRVNFDSMCKKAVEVSQISIEYLYCIFSERYPRLYLKKYSNPMQMIHHIYCTLNRLPEEVFYKSNLNEIALCLYTDVIDYNLTGTSPGEILRVPVKVLQVFNSRHGIKLLAIEERRKSLLDLYHVKPALFSNKWSYAQCCYFTSRFDEELTYELNYKDEKKVWDDDEEPMISSKNQWNILFFLRKYNSLREYMYYLKYRELRKKLKQVITYPLLPQIDETKEYVGESYEPVLDKMEYLCEVLFEKENEQLEEELYVQYLASGRYLEYKNEDYIVRYPYSIAEIIQESEYMHNCLWTYASIIQTLDTNILFLRKAKEPDIPYVDMEIRDNKIIQIYAKYNMQIPLEVLDFVQEYAEEKEVDLGCCVSI